jgi:hypothetical protein
MRSFQQLLGLDPADGRLGDATIFRPGHGAGHADPARHRAIGQYRKAPPAISARPGRVVNSATAAASDSIAA